MSCFLFLIDEVEQRITMKRIIFLFFILCAVEVSGKNKVAEDDSIYLFSYFKGEGEDGLHLAYSIDGLKWRALNQDLSLLGPTVAKDKLMRDPCIVMGPDRVFRMVWTVSWKDRGIGYAYSKDLVHWSKQKFLSVMSAEPNAQNCWAPEIFYDRKLKCYVIFWATTIPGRFPETDKTGDDGMNHRIYYTTTKNFRKFSETKLLYDQGFNVIDATLADAGSQILLFVKDETRHPAQKNIRLSTATDVLGPYSPPSKPITGKYWAEGPTAINIGGAWIVYFDKYMEGKYGAVRSTDLIHWEDISDKVSFPKGARHGMVFKIPESLFNKALLKLSQDL